MTLIPKKVSVHMPSAYHLTEMSLGHYLSPDNNQSSTPFMKTVTWNSSADCHGVPYSVHVIVGTVVGLMATLCTFGNIMVLLTFARHASLRTSSNIFIINLTVSDLIMAVVDFPIFTIASLKGCWNIGYQGCQIYGLTSSTACLVSINTLAAIAFDRYVVVVRRVSPIHRMDMSTAGATVVVIWAIGVFWSVLPMVGVSAYRLEGLGTSCTFNYIDRRSPYPLFFLALVVFNFFIPMLVICFCYVRIFFMVHRIKREIQLFQGTTSRMLRQGLIFQAEIKTALLAILIIVVFCVSWTPYVVIAFVGMFGNRSLITPTVSLVPNVLAKFSTASNSLLYALGHPEIRKRVKGLFFVTAIKEYIRPTSATAGNGSSAKDSVDPDIQMPELV